MAWLKRLATPWAKERKKKKFVVVPRGPHKLKESIPLLVVIRDLLEYAENAKEAKKIIKQRKVMVGKRIRTDPKFGLGLMDVIHIPSSKESFRAIPDKKGMKFIKIPEKESNLKICKIINKTVLKKGKIQLNLHDGRNIILEGKEAKNLNTNDSVLLQIPEQKIIKHLKLEKGATVLIIRGKNKNKIAKLKDIELRNRRKIAWLENGKNRFEAPFDIIIVIGKEKSVISLGEVK